ncbi:MAG: serine--tRNA ligase [Bacteroidota bacterium]|nr:serine--tRNA ligase [Bacteroidota bacterium]
MLTLRFIQENRDFIIERLKIKNFDAAEIISQILKLDKKRRSTQTSMDNNQAELNKLSKEIGQLFKRGNVEEANQVKEKNAQIKENIKRQSESLNKIEEELTLLLVQLPNIPHESVPPGKGEQDNIEIKSGGTKPELAQDALPHWDLAKKYDIIDFELGNKITGSGFPVYKGKGAKLQRALINYFLDQAIEAGYKEVLPPLMVNEDSGFGTGQLPDKEGQMYHVDQDNLYLIPTAEVPVTNIYRNEILSAKDFPIKMTAYTPCFRREAGSYGKDVRGLNRLHQFDKVEIVQFQHPEKSYDTLQEMLNHVESLVKALNLPYRILKLCGGDISFTSALTYDFEVYSVAQQKWLEVSSVSNFEAYQANRLKLRFKEEGEKKTKLAHTLNGSALALPRILAALLENNQTSDGIVIPGVLRPYTGFDIIH